MGLLLGGPLADWCRGRPPPPTTGTGTVNYGHQNRLVRTNISECSARIRKSGLSDSSVLSIWPNQFQAKYTKQTRSIEKTESDCWLLDFCWRGFLFVDRMATSPRK